MSNKVTPSGEERQQAKSHLEYAKTRLAFDSLADWKQEIKQVIVPKMMMTLIKWKTIRLGT